MLQPLQTSRSYEQVPQHSLETIAYEDDIGNNGTNKGATITLAAMPLACEPQVVRWQSQR
jgi:hypothetical protein